MSLLVTTSTIFVFRDALKNKLSILWGVGVFLLCAVFLPAYLIKRREKISNSNQRKLWMAYFSFLTILVTLTLAVIYNQPVPQEIIDFIPVDEYELP